MRWLKDGQVAQGAVVVGPVDQVVFGLQDLVARQLVRVGDVERVAQLRRAEVAGADGAHLARVDEPLVGAQGICLRYGGVERVREVHVDVVGAQARQRCADGLRDVGGRQAFTGRRVGGGALAHLGHDLHALALRGAAGAQPGADDAFRLAALVAGHPAAVDVGGVDGGQARVDQAVEHGKAGGLVGRPAQHVAAKNNARHFHAGGVGG